MDAISLVEYYLLILFFEKIEQLNWTNRARTVLHVRYKSLYISLPSSAKQQREMKMLLIPGTGNGQPETGNGRLGTIER